VSAAFCSAYVYTCSKARKWEYEALRMGVAGSIAHVIVECGFHVIDTVNVNAKADAVHVSTSTMVRKMWAKEGMTGFGRGISACFYSATVGGFIYFTIYKLLKTYLAGVLPNIDQGLVFALAGFISEGVTICMKYPFDLVKCRLQSVNYIFKYQSIPHAFRKEVKGNGIKALYEGMAPYLLTYTTFMAL